MKRFILILALVLMVAMPMMAERVTPETARKVAATFLSNNGAKAAQLTDLSKAAGFSNLYIFNAEQGFVVMSADDCVKPILGYSLTGKFVTEDMPENVRGWLQRYNDEIEYAIAHGSKSTADINQVWQDLHHGKAGVSEATPIVDALVKTKWNQGNPFNKLCPTKGSNRTVTGCVATAMAQVMKYWEHPTTGTDSHYYTWNEQTLSANFGATTYDWENMINTYTSSTDLQKTAVATLMYHCGVSVEMDYGTEASSASTYNVMYALETYFGYAPCMQYKSMDDYSEEAWILMLKRELNNGRPLQYRGSDAGGRGGHSFVCDGYDSEDNFHFNWGWGGNCNGFYSVNAMEPGTGGIGAGQGVYTVGESAIFGIEPISSLSAPTLSAMASNGFISLSWNEVNDAESYDIYKDNVKIATGIVEHTFIDNDVVPGTLYEYYVRAISGSTHSNPSNRVTKSAFYRDYVPSGLTASLTNNGIALTWLEPSNNSANLQYATNFLGRYGIGEGKSIYWAEVFASTRLTDFVGMYIEKVSAYCYLDGNYTLYIYEDNTNEETNKLCEQSITVTNGGWYDIILTTPVLLDCTKDLWIIMFYPYTEGSSESYWYPACCGSYDEIPYDEENAEQYNPRIIGESLSDLNGYVKNNISWLFRTYLTDGTYTYNIYDGETQLNTEAVIGTSYTHNNPDSDAAHQYTVKTNYYGGESEASNMAGLALGTASLNSLEMNANDKMTVTEGSTLSISGTLSNANPDNLVLENGAQIINNSDNVAATVKKAITTYTANDDGWYFIASPVIDSITPSEENGFLNGTVGQGNNTYDLYYYYEPEYLWKNYEAETFNLVHQQGYLYANGETEGTILHFAGTLLPSNTDVTISNLSREASELNGFNLVGNPFACNATIDQDCYVIDGNQVVLATTAPVLAPCEGVMVKATDENSSVTFTKATSAKGTSSKDYFDLVITQGKANVDRARVRLNEGIGMEKFSLNNKHSQISLWQEGQDFAVAYTNGATEMPVSFRASQNSTYTLTLEAGNFDLDYLHLIDNMTGADIDLLTNKSYTFEATTNDYASRFRLVFAHEDGPSTSSGAFAFVSNGKIVINQEGTLHIVDMTGRMVASRSGRIQSVPTTGITSGVYILRLINGDNVKTQKIVIE